MLRDLINAVCHGERFEPVLTDLENGGRVKFFEVADSNGAQQTYHGHWVSASKLWSQMYGQYGTRIVRGPSEVGSINADTGYMGAHYTANNVDGSGVSGNTAVPAARRFVSTNTDGANGAGIVRFVDTGCFRLQAGQTSPAAGNIQAEAILSATVLDGGIRSSPNLQFVEAGGQLAYSFLIPPVSGGTLNLAVRLGGGSFTTMATATHNIKQDLIVDNNLPFAANAGTADRQFQLNVINVNQSSGELFIMGCQFLRLGVNNNVVGAGPGGVAWSPLWMVGGQALAHFAHDCRGQNLLALAESFRQAYKYAGRIVVRIKHKGNDVNAAAIGSIAIDGTITGVASNTRNGYYNNFNFVSKFLYDAAILGGVPADRFHILAGAYHGRDPLSVYAAQRSYEQAECDVSNNGTAWGQRVTVVKGWELMGISEITARKWLFDGGAHLNPAGFDGFNHLEMAALLQFGGDVRRPRKSTNPAASVSR